MGFKAAPYISFVDGAADALEFYRDVLGGKLSINRMGDFPYPDMPASDHEKVMHGQLDLDNGFVLMAADTPTGMPHSVGTDMSVALFGDDPDELRRCFEELSNGGDVTMPFEKAPWGDWFGMLVDAFGVTWMLDASDS